MPTGYTAKIDEDPTMTAARWVTEGLSRAFGVCFSLRDSGDMTADQIEEHLKENIERSTKYYRKELDKTEKILAYINEKPDTYWTTEYDTMVKQFTEYNQKNKKETTELNARHNQIRQALIPLKDSTDDMVTKGLAKFGLEQLDLVKREHEPYIHKIPSFDDFQKEKLASLNRDLEYHKKNIIETEKREKDRLLAYQTIRSEVNRHLGSNEE